MPAQTTQTTGRDARIAAQHKAGLHRDVEGRTKKLCCAAKSHAVGCNLSCNRIAVLNGLQFDATAAAIL